MHGLDNLWVPMPDRKDAETAEEVEETSPRRERHGAALCAHLKVPEAGELQQASQPGVDKLFVLFDDSVDVRLDGVSVHIVGHTRQFRLNDHGVLPSRCGYPQYSTPIIPESISRSASALRLHLRIRPKDWGFS